MDHATIRPTRRWRRLSWRRGKDTGKGDGEARLAAAMAAVSRADAAAVLADLASSPAGLAEAEAERRLAESGPNRVAREARQTILQELVGRAASALNALLAALALVSWFLGDHRAALVIIVIVALSVGLAFLQEHRSNRAAEKLRAMVKTTVSVRRQSSPPPPAPLDDEPPPAAEIALERLVPGDIVTLSAGDMIPGDLRLLAAKDLYVNQSALTGEAMPVEKAATSHDAAADQPFELPNICWMGSNVVSGVATGVVLRTGASSYFGQLADSVVGQRALTSFDRGVDRFTWLLVRFMAIMVPTVFVINGLTKGDWLEALLFAVAVAVGLTPEMLPMIVTVNLAKGALAMSRRQVIVKRLNAIQNFGAMDILCTDKTGTLTQDRIILKRHLDIAGDDSDRVLDYAYLNSHYQSGVKNLLDVAVLKHVEQVEARHPVHQYRKVDEVPFDFQRRRLSVVLAREDGKLVVICKGAVEEVFAVCTRYELKGETGRLDASHLAAAKAETARLNADGFRVVAIAYKESDQPQASYGTADECDLVLLGCIAFLDPPKESAGAAIDALARNGVTVKILTGDNDIVTRKVCHDVGLAVDRIVLGHEIEPLDDDALAALAEEVAVFAKVSPAQKARVIDALHRRGHVVGFLGDGINDGTALKAADVGISVDTAVDIAKESADIILLEKSLLVLGEGVIEGRRVFGNINKYIKMSASSNFGNMLSVVGASLFLPFLPMTPIQILTNNLLYDFSQTAIPTDNVDAEYLARPRRWDIGNIARFMLLIGPISSIFDYLTYGLMLFVFHAWSEPRLFQTGWFVESLLTQTLIIHIIRTARIPFIQSHASTPLIATTLTISAIAVLLPGSWLGQSLGFVPLPPAYWAAIAIMLAAYATLTHLVKTWFIRRWGF